MDEPATARPTRGDIEKTARALQPDTVKVWCVEVAGRVFPVKQLVREAADQTVDARGTARKG